jgi:hypothetical protein
VAALRPRLKSHKEGIRALQEDGFEVEPVRFSTDNHLLVRVKREGYSAQVPISGSPGALFYRNLVQKARQAWRTAREWAIKKRP